MALHLVTGGSGFLGSNIVRLLHERKESVRVLDLWRDTSIPSGVEFFHGDINDPRAVAQAMTDVEYVHHAVALVPLAKAGRQFWKVNVEGTQVALRAAMHSGVRMFCHLSSSAIFGPKATMPITNETPPAPIEAYGIAKLRSEQAVLQAGRDGLPVSIVRPRTIVGPGRLGIFAILFEWIRDGANIPVIGSGNHLYQFVHVDDVAQAVIQCCIQGTCGVFNVGAETFGTLREDLSALVRHAGTKTRIKSIPPTLAIPVLALLDKTRLSPLGPWHYLTYHKPYYFDIAPTKSALGWSPRYSNQEILVQAYEWFISKRTEDPDAERKSSHRRPVRQGVLHLVKRFV